MGHAGLGSEASCHFTSPIRRYPDLIAHRALLSAIGGGGVRADRARVGEAGWHSSEREREAMQDRARTPTSVCAAYLLERELFEGGLGDASSRARCREWSAPGPSCGSRGELGDVYEGFLPARRLRGESFDLNETETALVGGRSSAGSRLGDPVKVRVESIEAPRGRVGPVYRPAVATMAERGRGKPVSETGSQRYRDVATNRRAGHKFELLDKFECGIELFGTEVKSLREGKAQLIDAYAVIDHGEVWLRNAHIPPYPRRPTRTTTPSGPESCSYIATRSSV